MQAQRIVFTPQWTPQSQFAGYYVAQEKGFYNWYFAKSFKIIFV